ncbi:HAMP domain-containing histidine kinase [Candidatus Gracilibacteria bacterium]|nr:HAMP domain-containing histidine kinase [Candidatus Gracilibacteria bacterium]
MNSVIAFVSRIKQLKSHGGRRDYSHPEKIYKDTIERQSDFIGMISHEIKTPITSAILQSESIMQDINSGDKSQKYLKNEITLLNVQLVRTGELLSKLFSVQYYDTHDVVLTREKILFRDFVTYEIAYYQEIHKEILFLTHIDPNLRFVELDRVQFRQVITNLVENAIKFVNAQKPIISITVQKVGTYFELIIEDNGAGFQGIEIGDLFDKYTSGKEKAIGIGMGLYLCKKIVELHSGTISATISQKYKGAKFTLCIPINN